MAVAPGENDEELMDRYCGGDAGAFDELFRRFAPRLLRFARPMVGAAQAHDVVQMTFLKMHENRHRYRNGAKVSSWLFTIARNTALDHVRSAPARREVGDDDKVHTAEARAFTRDVLANDVVRRAILDLPEEQRDVVLLHWFADLTFEEIAVIVKASSVAVRTRAHRAYEKLRAVLEPAAKASS